MKSSLRQKLHLLRLKYFLLSFVFFLCFSHSTSLESRNTLNYEKLTHQADAVITGKILDDAGSPLVGATVKIAGTNTGTVSDGEGNFSLNVTEGQSIELLVSFVGFEDVSLKNVTASNVSTPLIITLKPSATNLNNVVVVGYGTKTKREITGSVASVSSKDIREQAVTSFDQAIVGKMAGVQVIQTNGAPGGNISIRIRGVSSISAGSNPLFVIDGIPVTNDTRTAVTGLGSFDQPFNPLATINTNDIESIDVLKDAASAAIYGSRGSSGVVIITTKKGKTGKMRVSYDLNVGVQEVAKHVDVLDAYQYSKLVYDGHNNAYFDANPNGKASDPNSVRGTNPATWVPSQVLPYITGQQGLTNTDWQKQIFQKAPIQNHTLTISGGTDNTTYLFSGNYLDQDGIVINNNLKRYSARFRIDSRADKFRFGASINPAFTDNTVVNSEGPWFSPNNGVIALSLGYAPIFPVYNQDGTFADSVNVWGYGQTNQLNPVAVATLQKDRIKDIRLISNAYGQYEFFDGFSYKLTVASDLNAFRRDYFRPANLPTPGATSIATGYSSTAQYNNWLMEHTLNFARLFGQHKIDVIAGYSAQKETQDKNTLTATNFPTDVVQTLNAGQIASGSSTLEEWSVLSYLARASYNYAGKYFLSASVRSDGSSRFGKNNRYATFPAVSAAWNVSNEKFMDNVKAISSLKIRTSYGLTGNYQIPNYGSKAQLSNANSNYIFGNNVLTNGVSITSPANDNLTWENTASFDAGLEVGFFQNALSLTFDYYNSNTSKLLLNLPVPAGSGFNTFLQNIGEMNNSGVELGIKYVKNLNSDWVIEGGANYSANTNKVTKLGPSGAPIIQTGGTGNTYFITQIGQPISSYYVYNQIGIYQNAEDLAKSAKTSNLTKVGDFKFEDVNGDGKIDANDRKILGNFQPKFTFAWSNTIRYKSFDLAFQIQGTQGSKVMALLKRYIANVEGNFNNISSVLNYYVSPDNIGDGNTNRANRLATGGNGITSSWHIEDGSYVRITNINLGYNLPVTWLKNSHVSFARVYVGVQNAYTFTSYPFFNPEINNRPDNSLSAGEDYGSYPIPRTYTFGLNVTF